jgi:uncharacterized protein YbaR (Trm112 family)
MTCPGCNGPLIVWLEHKGKPVVWHCKACLRYYVKDEEE